MREKLISIGQDSYIEDPNGHKAFHIDGKVMRIRDTLLLKDIQENKLAKIQERKLRIKDTMEIEGPHGEQLATVKKALITPIRDRWLVKIGDGPDLDVQGNIVDHEYKSTVWPTSSTVFSVGASHRPSHPESNLRQRRSSRPLRRSRPLSLSNRYRTSLVMRPQSEVNGN